MNNFKYLVLHDLKEAAHFLCQVQERNKGCDSCPVQDRCEPGYNGWVDFLRSEHEGSFK